MTRAIALVALVLAGCTATPGATAAPSSAAVLATATATATATALPTPLAVSPSPAAATEFTADDEQIATLIKAGAADAVPDLRTLSDADPSKLALLFEPLGAWIKQQRSGVGALTASECTMAAVELYLDGINQYDSIRKKFLAWRDWGVHGHAFTAKAPLDAADTLEGAVAELELHCPQ